MDRPLVGHWADWMASSWVDWMDLLSAVTWGESMARKTVELMAESMVIPLVGSSVGVKDVGCTDGAVGSDDGWTVWLAGGNYELMAVQMVAAKALKLADELAEKKIDWLSEKLAGRSWLSRWLLRWLLCCVCLLWYSETHACSQV
jgi:hypothetical protein